MKWVIFAVVAVVAVVYWGLMGAIWMSNCGGCNVGKSRRKTFIRL